MKMFHSLCAVAALALAVPAAASAQPPALMLASITEAASSATLSLKPGENVYDSAGVQIGTIKSMSTSEAGTQTAIVSVGRFLGMGSRDVAIPVTRLSVHAGGGYTASLTSDQIKQLPDVSTK